jgi:hypothetical protein
MNYCVLQLGICVKGKGKVVPVLFFFCNWAPHHEGVLGNRDIDPRNLTSALDGGEWSASRPRKSHCYPLYRRLGGPQSLSRRGAEKKNSEPLTELEPTIIQPVAQRYTTELSRLLRYLCP